MERANAAQMAARSIKAKPKGRMGGRAGPRPDSSTPQFAPPSQNGGGLFGGSIQGSGSFDFAAPGGMTLAAPSFGSNATSSPDVSDNEGRYAGDDRAMKRQFGGPSTMQQVQKPTPFGQTPANPFGASTAQPSGSPFQFGNSSGTAFSNPGNAPASNPFSFGNSSQPQPANTGFSFGSGAAETKPASSPFQFGQQAAQPPFNNSPFNFSNPAPQAQAAPQSQASTSVFNFGSTAPQSTNTPHASNSPFSFGSTAAQDKPAATPFVFGQAPAAPSSSAVNFGTTTSTAPSSSNLFGTSTAPSNLFGASTAPPAQAVNAFGLPATQPPTNGLFGNLNAVAPSTNSPFGNRAQSPAPPSNNLFGGPANIPSASTELPPTPSLFGGQNNMASSNTLNQPAPKNNLFGSSSQATASPANGIFGKPQSTGTNGLFGHLNKPADEPAKHEKASNGVSLGFNGNASTKSTAEASSPFKKTSTLFGNSSSSNNKSSNGSGTGVLAPFTPTPSSLQQVSNVSSPSPITSTSSSLQQVSNASPLKKSFNAITSSSQPPPSGMFSSLTTPGVRQPNIFRAESPVDDDPNLDLVALPPVPAGHVALSSGPDPFHITDEQIAKVLPSDLKDDPQSRGNWITKYKIESLNRAMSDMFDSIPANQTPKVMLMRYMKLRVQLIEDNNAFQEQFNQSGSNRAQLAIEAPKNQLQKIGSATSSQTPNKRKMVEDESEANENPSKRTKEQSSQAQAPTVPASQAAAIFKPYSNGTGTSEISKPSQESGVFMPPAVQTSSSNLATPSPIKNKRKAETQITKDDEVPSPLRHIKTPRLNGTTVGSNTSNLFKNILDSPSPSKSGNTPKPQSPLKKAVSVPESNEDTPRVNPFGKLPIPASSAKPTFSLSPSAPPSNCFTPKAPAVPSLFNTKTTPASSNAFTPKATDTPAPVSKPAAVATNDSAPTTTASTFKPPVFTSGPVDFLAQFGKKASEDKKDNEEKLLQKAIDEDYDSDDDLEEFKQKYHEKRKAELRELEDLAKNTRSSFVFKVDGATPAATPASSNAITAKTETAPKPLFGQSTAQGPGNSVFSSLNVSRTSTPGPVGSSTGSVLDGNPSTKPVSFAGNIFAHLSDADSGKGNDADDESADEETDGDEENRDPNYQPGNDNASGHGTPASETGAGIASVKKSNFFSNYGSARVASPLGTPGSSTPTGGLFGRVGSKEPSTGNEQSGSTTPSGGLFGRVGSKETVTALEQSGTSTPGRSLFDRISKDSNGTPVRHISTEEKENTQPSAANIFKPVGSPFGNPFSKIPGVSTDKTWKPDSPIRFGADTEASNSAPTLSITAATPTKAGNPSNLFGGPTSTPTSSLFGNKESKPAPAFSNLFGNSNSAKGPSPASVGFGFGAPSVTSSLFPSVAGSANTSRATSPGGATDGDSGVDGDPDAEVHEQINLTAGGPGEEDEEVLHEVRAKALLYTATPDEDGKSWIPKGLGPLRVLQHKDTKATRILLRADPLGNIVLNKALLSKVTYEATAKTVKFMASADDGKGLETWLLQVKTVEAAEELAKTLEKNK